MEMETRVLFGSKYFLPQTESRRTQLIAQFKTSEKVCIRIFSQDEIVFESTEIGFVPYRQSVFACNKSKIDVIRDFARVQVSTYLHRCLRRNGEAKFCKGQMLGSDSTQIYRDLLNDFYSKPIEKDDLIQVACMVLYEYLDKWDIDIYQSWLSNRICFTTPIWHDINEIWKSGEKVGQLKDLTVWTMCQRALDKEMASARTKNSFEKSWESFTTSNGTDCDIKKNANFETLFNLKCDLFASTQTMEEVDYNSTVYSFLKGFIGYCEKMENPNRVNNSVKGHELTSDSVFYVKAIINGFCFGEFGSHTDIKSFAELAQICNTNNKNLDMFLKRVFKPLFKEYCLMVNDDCISFVRKFKASESELNKME